MNPSPTSPARPTAKQSGRWLVEIVRGRDVGRTFALDPGETVVGNALNGQRGIDLLDQEGNSPRRMAPRHAAFSATGQDLTVQDLQSPGGTFVNQQRLLSGQPRKLSAGDVIQLGGVQLKVKLETATAAPPAPAPAPQAATKNNAVLAAPAAHRPPERATKLSDPPVALPPSAAKSIPPPAPRTAPPVAGPPPAAARPSPPASGPAPPAPRAAPSTQGGRLPTPFSMAHGGQCRSWDDFLVLSAQSWGQVRDELTSGRLTEYLRRIGRLELIPHAAPDKSPDDRLDEWLARLPATQSSAPELDVHPETLLVQAKMGGGITRLSLRITNVGFRLLRSSVRLEPSDARWVKLLAGQDGRPFQTIDQTDIPVELELPEKIDRLLRAIIVVESNGGTRRVEVRVERPADPLLVTESGAVAAVSEIPVLAQQLSRRLTRVSLPVRIAACCAGAIGLRLLVRLGNALPIGGVGKSLVEPRMASVALIAATVGVLAGLILAHNRGERRDLLTAGLAGGLVGLLSSAPWFSILQSTERFLGSWSSSMPAICLFWGASGAVLALLSTILIPYRRENRQVVP